MEVCRGAACRGAAVGRDLRLLWFCPFGAGRGGWRFFCRQGLRFVYFAHPRFFPRRVALLASGWGYLPLRGGACRWLSFFVGRGLHRLPVFLSPLRGWASRGGACQGGCHGVTALQTNGRKHCVPTWLRPVSPIL